MPITKREKTWYVRFTAPDGSRVFVSARTQDRTQAQEYHDRLKAEYWRVLAGRRTPTLYMEPGSYPLVERISP